MTVEYASYRVVSHSLYPQVILTGTALLSNVNRIEAWDSQLPAGKHSTISIALRVTQPHNSTTVETRKTSARECPGRLRRPAHHEAIFLAELNSTPAMQGFKFVSWAEISLAPARNNGYVHNRTHIQGRCAIGCAGTGHDF